MLEEPAQRTEDVAGASSGKRQGIALCLSGGGYRAMLFHLGAARRLHEVGLLRQVDTISSVSGGSIFAALLASAAARVGSEPALRFDDFDAQVAEPVRALARRDIRTAPFLANLAWNWILPGPRARALERTLVRHVSDGCLRDLPQAPLFVICATDLTFGANWESSRLHAGSWRAGYLVDGGAWPIARAVAASACFPPIFGPLPVGSRFGPLRRGDVRTPDGRRLHRRLALSDGGVYDNMGLEPVWKTHECILVSDGGAPFEFSASRSPLRRLMRYTSVISNQAQSVRRRMFFAEIRRRTYEGTYWAMRTEDAEPGYPAQLIDERIACVRTDLDRFTDGEQRVLENHGYCVASARLAAKLPHRIVGAPPPQPPNASWMEEQAARRALRHSDRRIWPPRMAGRG